MTHKRLLVAAIWILCGIVNWSLTLGYFDHRFPEFRNTVPATFEAILGPAGTVVVLTIGQPYHWRFIPPSTDELWQRYHKRWPNISYEEFRKDDE